MKHLIISTMAIAALTACGGGSSSSGNSNAGQISGITGLGYQTASKSGVINQNNEFDFVDGETITLFLGGAELASATASKNMNLFDFFPNLPQDAAGLRQALRLPEYSKERLQAAIAGQNTPSSSELYTASNIMRLLIALDDDGDTANGLNLLSGNWHSKLANETASSLNLESNMFDFADSYAMDHFQEQYEVSINMDVSEPLATLYDMAQVTIQAKRITGHTTPQLSPSETGSYEYNSKQRLITLTTVNSSTPSTTITKTYAYDAKGNLLKDYSEADTNSDGTLESYNRRDYTYNDFGQTLTQTYDYDQNAGNADFRRTVYENTYENNRVLRGSTNEKEDSTGDGTFDFFAKTTYSYNADNLKTSYQYEDVDESGNRISISSRRVYTYNDQGQLTREDHEKSFAGDTAQSIDRSEFTRDGNTVTKTLNYISLNAPMGSSTYKDVFVETFNDAGNITKKTKAEYVNNVLDAYAEVSYSYDNQSRITECLYDYDTSGDEQFNYAKKYLRGFDANGITSTAYKVDYDNDGVFADDETYAATYGSNAELLTEGSDYREFTYSDESTNDGVRYLVHEYLDITREIFQSNFSNCYLDAYNK